MRIVDALRTKQKMLKVPECAQLLGVAENSFHELLKSEIHPTYFTIFGSSSRLGIRIDSEDLAAWLTINETVGFVIPDPSVVNEEPEVIPAPETLPIVEESSDAALNVVMEPPVPVSAELEEEEVEDPEPDPKYAGMSIGELRALTSDQAARDEIYRRKQLLRR
jgi:predicted DNA-binding transcriptional regulator AlpA